MGATEKVLLAIMIIITIGSAILMRKDILAWLRRRQYGLLGIFGSECPYCHTRYLHESDMQKCRHNRWDGKGIKSERYYENSGWPPGL